MRCKTRSGLAALVIFCFVSFVLCAERSFAQGKNSKPPGATAQQQKDDQGQKDSKTKPPKPSPEKVPEDEVVYQSWWAYWISDKEGFENLKAEIARCNPEDAAAIDKWLDTEKAAGEQNDKVRKAHRAVTKAKAKLYQARKEARNATPDNKTAADQNVSTTQKELDEAMTAAKTEEEQAKKTDEALKKAEKEVDRGIREQVKKLGEEKVEKQKQEKAEEGKEGDKPKSSQGSRLTCPKDDEGVAVFGGYSYLRPSDEEVENLNGFKTSLFYNFNSHVGIGAEFSGVYGSSEIGANIDTALHRYTYLFGPQFSVNLSDKVKLFVHPLFGGVHDTIKTDIGSSQTDFSANAFAMAFGGGMDVRVSPHVSVRVFQFDYTPTHFGGEWQNNFGVSSGLVFRFK